MSRYRRLPAVERRLTGGRVLVQPLGASTPTQLSGSAPVIWELLLRHEDLEELIEHVQSRFVDAPGVIEAGTRSAVEHLLGASLIEELRCDDASPRERNT